MIALPCTGPGEWSASGVVYAAPPPKAYSKYARPDAAACVWTKPDRLMTPRAVPSGPGLLSPSPGAPCSQCAARVSSRYREDAGVAVPGSDGHTAPADLLGQAIVDSPHPATTDRGMLQQAVAKQMRLQIGEDLDGEAVEYRVGAQRPSGTRLWTTPQCAVRVRRDARASTMTEPDGVWTPFSRVLGMSGPTGCFERPRWRPGYQPEYDPND